MTSLPAILFSGAMVAKWYVVATSVHGVLRQKPVPYAS